MSAMPERSPAELAASVREVLVANGYPDPDDTPQTDPLAALSELERLAERQRDALEQAIKVIEWCGLNDRSEPYAYGEARPNGDVPREGACFNTPREFARYWPEKLRAAALASLPDGEQR